MTKYTAETPMEIWHAMLMPWKLESFLIICQDDRLCELKTTDGADESFNKTIFANLVIHCVAADDVVHVTLYQILGRVDDSSKI